MPLSVSRNMDTVLNSSVVTEFGERISSLKFGRGSEMSVFQQRERYAIRPLIEIT